MLKIFAFASGIVKLLSNEERLREHRGILSESGSPDLFGIRDCQRPWNPCLTATLIGWGVRSS